MAAEPQSSWQHTPALNPSNQLCRALPASDAVELGLHEALSGRIFLVKAALQRYGILEPVRQATFSALADTVSLRAARDLEDRGLEQLHTVATPPQASALRSVLETRLKPLAAQMTFAFLEGLSRQRSPLYLGKHFGVRMMMPEASIAVHRAVLQDMTGFMVPREPHRDSWFNTGVNSINLWAAISRVRRGNGLLIFPDAYRREVRRLGDSADPDVAVGAPINFEMEAGDILVFAGDHLHSSEPNETDETRCVLTKRISLGAPRYSPHGTSWVPYYDRRLLGTSLEPLASLRSRISSSYARSLLRTFAAWSQCLRR